ncbi:MAG: metallophosphoesterase, partial [Clostridiales bacterium]|nr:metallophosphoesterase [Clostridiales bacterium]
MVFWVVILLLNGFGSIISTIEVKANEIDSDGDGISDYDEIHGFTWDNKTYFTNPYQKSSDFDPYDDYMEITGINMPSAVTPPGRHPCVPSYPDLKVELTGIDVITKCKITSTELMETGSSWSIETEAVDRTKTDWGADCEITPFPPYVKIKPYYHHEHETTTKIKTSTSGWNQAAWSRAIAIEPDKAAKLKFHIKIENKGTDAAKNIRLKFNVKIGEKVIDTVWTDVVAFRIEPNDASGEMVIDHDITDGEIIVTLEELKSIECGSPISIDITEIQADVPWAEGYINWGDYMGNINPVSATILADFGDGNVTEYKVWSGIKEPSSSPQYIHDISIKEAINWTLGIREIGNRTYVGWKIAKESDLENWTFGFDEETYQQINEGLNKNWTLYDLLNVTIKQGWVIALKAPDFIPPEIHWALYSENKREIKAAISDNYNIENVTAYIKMGESYENVTLTDEDKDLIFNATLPKDIADVSDDYIKVFDGNFVSKWVDIPIIFTNGIIYPSLGFPSITTPRYLRIITSGIGSESVLDWNVSLLRGQEYVPLIVESVSNEDGKWKLSTTIPDNVSTGLYDLLVEIYGQTYIEPHAVQIIYGYPNSVHFLHLTDPHINVKKPETSQKFMKVINETNLIHPDFVILTGDLVDWSFNENWQEFHNLMLKFNVPVYTCPGNHDYRDSYICSEWWDKDGLDYYFKYINPYDNYSFNYGNYHFVSLNSGFDVPWDLDMDPEGSGLTDEQINWLENDLENNMDKSMRFIFMHHPAINYDDHWGDATISQNQDEFLQLCSDYNVTMVMTGHTHVDKVYDKDRTYRDGYTKDNLYMGTPIFLQTRSATQGYWGYRMVIINNSSIESYTYDLNGNGLRDGNSAIPAGHISISYDPANDGTHDEVVATINNGLRENFTEKRGNPLVIRFNMTRLGEGYEYYLNEGRIISTVTEANSTLYYVQVNITQMSQKQIRIFSVGGNKPQTWITSSPYGVIHVNYATFNWNGWDNETPVDKLLYSYRLIGSNSEWSDWMPDTSKTFTNLADGNYTFEVKAKDEDGNEDSTPAKITFTIKSTRANITIWIHRIRQIDEIDPWNKADWKYEVSVFDLVPGFPGWVWLWKTQDNACSEQDDWLVNRNHSFDINRLNTTIKIKLWDVDSLSGDDLADVSGCVGEGKDNDNSHPDIRGAIYYGDYDLRNNSLTGDTTGIETIGGKNYIITRGDYPPDNSTIGGINDAEVWFNVYDNYELPSANAGPNQTAYTNELIDFDGSKSTASGGSYLMKYQWDFNNDGYCDYEGITGNHVFYDDGIYEITLKVTDNYNEIASDMCFITVLNRNPYSNFSYTPLNPSMLDIIQFNDLSWDEDGNIDSWHWDFGDGNISYEQNPVHQYAYAGVYNVTLTVMDDDGATNATSKQIIVIKIQHTLTASVNPSGSGSITLNPTGGTYDYGTVVTLTAVANTG